jgi:hypothetical protein
MGGAGGRFSMSLTPDELIEGLRIRLGHRRVTQSPGPLARSSVVGFGRVGGAPDGGGERENVDRIGQLGYCCRINSWLWA